MAFISDYVTRTAAMLEYQRGFSQFMLPKVQSMGGIPVGGGPRLPLEAVQYNAVTNADATAAVQAIARGQDMSGNSTGNFHMIVAGTDTTNPTIIAAAQAAGIPNLHVSGGNPAIWRIENNFAYGLHMPFTWYVQDLLRIAQTRGLQSVMIIRSVAATFPLFSGISSLAWAQQFGFTVVGPSADWCQQNATQAGSGGCRLINGNCICGTQAEVDSLGYMVNITSAPGFYQVDERRVGNGFVANVADSPTADFFQNMFADVLARGVVPDIVIQFVQEHHNLLIGMKAAGLSPKMFVGFNGGTPINWAVVNYANGTQALNPSDGWWTTGVGQWHPAMRFVDPIFGSSLAATSAYKQLTGTDLNYFSAGAAVALVVAHEAMRKYASQTFVNMTLAQQRDTVRLALGSVNDETLWGMVRFNRVGQNSGRGTAAWQILPDQAMVPQSRCVLPTEAAEREIVLPFASWPSRYGCPPGTRNTAQVCLPCGAGTFSGNVTLGLAITSCQVCPKGVGTAANATGSIACSPCPDGFSQDPTVNNGVMVPCSPGSYRMAGMDAGQCQPCAAARFASSPGSALCKVCPAGTWQVDAGKTECPLCETGRASGPGVVSCTSCPMGTFANISGASQCAVCPAGLGTESVGATSSSACGCMPGFYQPPGTGSDLCLPCGEGTRCQGQRSPVQLVAGYYAFPDNPLSVYSCGPPAARSKAVEEPACAGGTPGVCAGQRRGFLCKACPEGQGLPTGGSGCTKCGSNWIPVLIVIILGPGGAIYVYYAGNRPLHEKTTAIQRVGLAASIIVTTIQLLGMCGKLGVPWPDASSGAMSTFAFLNFEPSTLGLPCLVGTDPSAIYGARCAIPFAVMPLYGLVYLASKLLGRARSWELNKTFNASMQIYQALFIAMVMTSVAPFQCYIHPNQTRSVLDFPTVLCGGSDHRPLVALGLIVLGGLVAPFVAVNVWATVVAAQKSQKSLSFTVRFRYLFFSFRPDVWWWRLVLDGRQLVLSFAPILQQDDPAAQLLYAVAIFCTYMALVCTVQPWRTHECNGLDSISSLLLALILVTAGTFLERSINVTGHISFLFVLLLALGCTITFVLVREAVHAVLPPSTVQKCRCLARRPVPAEVLSDEIRQICELLVMMPADRTFQLVQIMGEHDRAVLTSFVAVMQAAGNGEILISQRIPPRLNVTGKLTTLEQPNPLSEEESKKLKEKLGPPGTEGRQVVQDENLTIIKAAHVYVRC